MIVDYLIMIALCFFILPFTYFYAEETLDSEDDLELEFADLSDEDDEVTSTKHSSTASTKGRKA